MVTIITFIVLCWKQPPAHLVTLLKRNVCHRQELGGFTFATWLSHSAYQNVLCRSGEMKCVGSQGEKTGWKVARPDSVSVATLCGLWSQRREMPALRHEGHDPRYDLVKKPLNVSTSQRFRCDSAGEAARGDAKTFIIVAPPYAVRSSRLFPIIPSPWHSSNREAHNSFRDSAISDSSEDGLRSTVLSTSDGCQNNICSVPWISTRRGFLACPLLPRQLWDLWPSWLSCFVNSFVRDKKGCHRKDHGAFRQSLWCVCVFDAPTLR